MKENKPINDWKTYVKLFFSWLLYVVILYFIFLTGREAYKEEQQMKKQTIENVTNDETNN